MNVIDLMSGFIVELRNAGIPVSLTENLDAMTAVKEIPLEDREAFKYALAATLVKSHNHWRSFETIFEVYFSLRGPEYAIVGDGSDGAGDAPAPQPGRPGDGSGSGGGLDGLTPEEIGVETVRPFWKEIRR